MQDPEAPRHVGLASENSSHRRNADPRHPSAGAQSWPGFARSQWWQQIQGRSVLMLDYDGTLAPFVRDRMQARPYPGVSERLRLLALAPRLRLVLVSGRPAYELSSLLPPSLKVELWGSHGRERLNPDGGYTAVPLRPAQQQCLDELEAALHQRGLAHVIERKIGSVALHTRGLPEADAQQIASLARDFSCIVPEAGPEDQGLEWLPFDGGFELRGSGYTKATAVLSILRDERPGAPVAYLGDDQTDEDAFLALRQYGHPPSSLAVLVRPEPRPTAAHLWLRPPHELLAFLDHWLAVSAGSSKQA